MASWRGLGGAGGKVRLAIPDGVRSGLPLPAMGFDLLGTGAVNEMRWMLRALRFPSFLLESSFLLYKCGALWSVDQV